MTTRPEIKYLFEPRTVAIIGASQNPSKIGFKIIENIKSSGYPGIVLPVNPKGGNILGYNVYQDITLLPDEIDLAVIAVPANRVFESVKSCALKSTKFLSIISSGFSEIGNIEEEKRIVDFALKNGMRILGPNIFGIYSGSAPINATFGPGNIKKGNVAIITQSGALGVAMIGKTSFENIGLSAIVSVGNKSDINEADLLEYFCTHNDTKVILIYIEGVKHGDTLVETLRRATRIKPVIVIKAGKSKRGAIAAASHTGSLAGSYTIFSKIMKQCGALQAETIREALEWCKFLSTSPQPEGENTVIITNGGGVGVMATDSCEKYGVNLYDDISDLKQTFSTCVPEFGSYKNPIDLTGQATAKDFEVAINSALDSKAIHSIICLLCETATFDALTITSVIEEFLSKRKFTKPIVFSLFGGETLDNVLNSLKKLKISAFSDTDEAVSCFGALYSNYRLKKEKIVEEKIDTILHPLVKTELQKIKSIIHQAKSNGRHFLLPAEARGIMQYLEIKTPKSMIARNIEEAISYSEKIGYPVAMKIVSPDITHKSDVGGVALNLNDKQEIIDAFQAIMHNCKKHFKSARIEGVEIAEMITGGVETIVGAMRDNSFGPIVMFGLGGKYVEVMKDTSFRAFPLRTEEILHMISETRAYTLLLGVRGEAKKDVSKVIETIVKIGSILYLCPEISDIEINPLVVHDEKAGITALDTRIILSKDMRENK